MQRKENKSLNLEFKKFGDVKVSKNVFLIRRYS